MEFYTAIVRSGYSVTCFTLLVLSCLIACSNEDELSGSRYIILNEKNGQGNFSLYDYPSKKVTEQFYTIDSDVRSRIYEANRNGNFMYISTDYWPGKLRKIDLTTGAQVGAVTSWIDTWPNLTQVLDFYKTNIVTSNAAYDSDDAVYRLYIKIYDETLSLQDSIVEENIYRLNAAKIVNDRLFCSVETFNEGYRIKVMNLNTRTFIKTIGITDPYIRFISLNERQLLGVQNNGFSIIDTESMEVLKSTQVFIGSAYVTVNLPENVLYCIRPLAQPSAVPYILSKIDLVTGEASNISDYGERIDSPIMFDLTTSVIISGGGVKIFSKEGRVLQQSSLLENTSHLFIK